MQLLNGGSRILLPLLNNHNRQKIMEIKIKLPVSCDMSLKATTVTV